MKKNKLFTVLALMLVVGISLQGCGNVEKNNKLQKNEETAIDEQIYIDEQREESKSTEQISEITENNSDNLLEEEEMYNIPELNIAASDIPDTGSLEFIRDMKLGWNLGNTLDAINESVYDENGSGQDMNIESSWCGIKTTKEMIDSVKQAGFNTIRVPVSWHNHVYGENFTINEQWLNRVKEVVDYGIENNMYVILNIHHDMEKEYCYPTNELYDNSIHYMTCIWDQLSAKFAEYDDHLIFESINEPRLAGHPNEWWYDPGNQDCREALDCINRWNQNFVDVVRATGGNNAKRYLMVPSYAASGDNVLIDDFKLPTDIEGNDNKIIVSVHAYIPYHYALQAENESDSVSEFRYDSSSDTADIDRLMSGLYEKFVKNEIPVLIGEFGSRAKTDNEQSRVEHAAYYIAAARARGISCCWWDNNAFTGDGELFGLLDRKNNSWKYPDILEALVKYAE